MCSALDYVCFVPKADMPDMKPFRKDHEAANSDDLALRKT
jgi:hypothetical protein